MNNIFLKLFKRENKELSNSRNNSEIIKRFLYTLSSDSYEGDIDIKFREFASLDDNIRDYVLDVIEDSPYENFIKIYNTYGKDLSIDVPYHIMFDIYKFKQYVGEGYYQCYVSKVTTALDKVLKDRIEPKSKFNKDDLIYKLIKIIKRTVNKGKEEVEKILEIGEINEKLLYISYLQRVEFTINNINRDILCKFFISNSNINNVHEFVYYLKILLKDSYEFVNDREVIFDKEKDRLLNTVKIYKRI